jgi:hypothetical protein
VPRRFHFHRIENPVGIFRIVPAPLAGSARGVRLSLAYVRIAQMRKKENAKQADRNL